jgi:MFS family permease
MHGRKDLLQELLRPFVLGVLEELLRLRLGNARPDVRVDRVGRRALMLAGCGSIGCSHLLLGAACAAGWKGLPVLVFTLCSLGAYALSLAPVTWVLIAEIFPNRVRARGQARVGSVAPARGWPSLYH